MSATGTLVELQQRCQQAILDGNALPGLFAGEGSGNGGFGIYLQAYRARLASALQDNYPVLLRAIGDDAFAALANAYITRRPSRFRSIRWFGDCLADFLTCSPEHLPHPSLVDLARMDWAMRAAFDAADAQPLGASELAALHAQDWPQHRFRLLPSLQLLRLDWQVEPIWKALDADPLAGSDEPLFLPHVLLVWRPQLECRWRSAAPLEASVLEALSTGASFAACCDLIADSGDAEPAATAAGFVQGWIADGLLARESPR
ncbi:MAG TPA: DNA-binding domain-containing protein [Accumulibacter sp.]|uniref:DNA-binding domain-containing protein n=1 Tax=Accumulibacter sp. TaxID=2053492 RepID=UPI002BAD6CDB|nr:DNA-binding domain-containing protein [Accumulibacter sp.]HRD89517.1 DNA-binding domain-containing protein [Accumulibacter sp.]